MLNYFGLKHLNDIADGSLSGGVNKEGIRNYNNLINELPLKGMHVYC